MDIRLDGKRALVTGAGKGIGRDIARLLVACGATVVGVSRSPADVASLQRELDVEGIVADLTHADAAREAARGAGKIDLLVNNAGISIPQSFLDTTVEAFDETMAVNVRAALIVSQVVCAGMIRRRHGGAIVNVSSQSSMVGLTDHAAYCASKGGAGSTHARHGGGTGAAPDPGKCRQSDSDDDADGRDGVGRPGQERSNEGQDSVGPLCSAP